MLTRRQLAAESWSRFVGYVPEMGRPWFAAAWLAAVVCTSLAILGGAAWLSRRVPYGALGVQASLVAGMTATAYLGFWRHREAYRERYGQWAYRALFFRYVGPTVALLGASAWLPLATAQGQGVSWGLSRGVAAYCFLSGGLISARGRALFWNIDLRAFVYSVFPEEGGWVRSPLFDLLRHPIYSAAVRMILGLAAVRNNAEALASGLLLAAGFALWSGLEDREMAGRFPEYDAYRRRTPGLFVLRPARVLAFWRYLVVGNAGAPALYPQDEAVAVVAGEPVDR